ncbi:S10 family peptidase [Chloroflexota bacterium]
MAQAEDFIHGLSYNKPNLSSRELNVTDEKEKKNEKPEAEKKAPEEKSSVTKHSITIKGETLAYTVTAGTIVLKDEDEKEGEKPKASIFYIAYSKDGVEDPAERPITFSFNGGPGSSSIWLHLGVLGPKRVLMDDEGNPPAPPYKLVPNDFTLLDKTDLVFIDPVSTGFSRAVPGEKADQFHEVKKDIESVGDFIRLWMTRNQRWASPKFLIGESYGTTRAAGLAGYLHQRHGMYLNGVMLVSSILNFQTAYFHPGNDLPFILFLPTYTATAWYHNKLDKELQKDLRKTLDEVEHFTMNEYTLALMQGSALPAEEHKNIVEKLARYTGLSADYIERTDLRINIHRFCKELRRDEGLTVGRLDSRFTGFDHDSAGEATEMDPSYSAIHGPYGSTLNDYVRRDLDFEFDLPYEILAPIYLSWKYGDFENRYLNVAENLRQAFQMHPALKVIVCNGYYDMATPYLATEYTFNHIGLPLEQRQNISMTYYEAGHMMYLHIPSLKKLKADLDAFIALATSS